MIGALRRLSFALLVFVRRAQLYIGLWAERAAGFPLRTCLRAVESVDRPRFLITLA